LNDAGVKFKGGQVPTSALRDQIVITRDTGVREDTLVSTPALLHEQIERAVPGEKLDEGFLRAEDAAKVRGNRQLAAAVFETVARSKQQRRAEQHALHKVNVALATAQIRPVQELEAQLQQLVYTTSLLELLQAITVRVRVTPILLYAY